MIITGLGAAPAAAPGSPRAAASSFAVAPPSTRPGGLAPASAASPLDAMLALQEQQGDATRDREARRHGHALLQALAALQHALLAGHGEGECLQRLCALGADTPIAADPGLAAVLRGVVLRAQIELARRGL